MNNGYCSVTINGKDVGLKFGMPANRMFFEKMALKPEILSGDTVNEVGICHLIYAGYVNNCLVKDIEPELTFGFFMEWVEEALVDEGVKGKLQEVSNCYSESKFTQKCIEEINNKTEDLKKKITEMIGTTLNPSVTENLDAQQDSGTN